MKLTKNEATAIIVKTLKAFYVDGRPEIDIVIGLTNDGHILTWADADAEKKNMHVGLFGTAHAGGTWDDPNIWNEEFVGDLQKHIAELIEMSTLAQVNKQVQWQEEK